MEGHFIYCKAFFSSSSSPRGNTKPRPGITRFFLLGSLFGAREILVTRGQDVTVDHRS